MTTSTILHLAYANNGVPVPTGGQYDIDTLKANVVTDVGTLVSDGASPTQAHVTTLNTDFTAFKKALSNDVTIIIDAAVTPKLTALKAIFADALLQAQANGIT